MLYTFIDYITLWSMCLLVLCSAGRVKRIVGGHKSKPPPPDDPVIFARIYNRDARVEGFRNNQTKIYTFLGLYYAEPPIGINRYARPIYKRLAGDINAIKHGPPCLQPDPYNPSRVIGDENCLLVNVYTPRMPDESTPGLPVIVWIHPGGYRFGSANQYDATPLAQNNVIVVAPQYRLGSLGIMGDGTKEFNGNLAMFDLATALRWVKDYIAYFGGDPKNIQAMGHGSGAVSAMYLSTSRSARNAADINSVVAMSGSSLSQYAIDKEPLQSVEDIAKINNCPTTDELEIVKCLREKSAEDIILNDSQVQTERLANQAIIKGITGGSSFQPHVEYENDNRALPSLIEMPPEKQLKSGQFTPIPLLTGVVKHETGNAFKSADKIQNIFGSVETFLYNLTDSLKDLKGFLRIDQITQEILKPSLPGLTGALTPSLEDVLRIPQTFNVQEILSKVIESTTDILFNLPAVLTTQVWSKIAPAYMYSFEHVGNKSKGINFLQGLPIVADTDPYNSIVGHGDELGYMFDCNDLYGNPLTHTQLTDDNDLKVRRNLINMIVNFVKSSSGTNKSDNDKSATTNLFGNLFKGVTEKSLPFIKIDTDLKAANDFRFCELSILGADLSPLTSISCKNFGNILSSLGDGFNNLTNLTNTFNPNTWTNLNNNPLLSGKNLVPTISSGPTFRNIFNPPSLF